MIQALILFLLLLTTSCSSTSPGTTSSFEPEQGKTVIAFGSCHNQHIGFFNWEPVLENNPDIWIWAGDVIYSDTEEMYKKKEAYDQLKNDPGYRKFIERVPVTGTWDDHDYGRNSAGSSYPMKEKSKDLFLDFMDVPVYDERRSAEGIYTSLELGSGDRKVKIIIPDLRYFRDEESGDLLGNKQWRWLRRELRNSRAALNLIVTSSTFIIDDQRTEKWSDFPKERQKLIELIGKTGAPVVFLAGDRHYGDISVLKDTDAGYPLYELLSSGMTHHREGKSIEPNSHRVGEFYEGENFGIVEVDWTPTPTVTLQIRDTKNQVQLKKTVPVDELRRW